MTTTKRGLIVREKWEKLIAHIQEKVFPNMPVCHRDTIGVKLMNELWRVDELLISLELNKGDRKELIRKIDVKKYFVLMIVRVCFRTRLINDKLYELIMGDITEIGKMIGGLEKSRVSQINKDKEESQDSEQNIVLEATSETGDATTTTVEEVASDTTMKADSVSG